MMKLNNDIRSGDKKVDKYIEELEGYIDSLNGSNIAELIKACDEASGVMADDVRLLITENDDDVLESRLQMLGSKKNKRFEAFLTLVKSVKDLDNISDMINKRNAKKAPNAVEENKSAEEVVVKKKKTNLQDFVT